jgi:hypothetical protein|tara:strand:+ start:122385 stop:123131 length:747 start_codon:yes stop_codon:yes gene_type:complete
VTALYLILGSQLNAQRDLANYLCQHGLENPATAAIYFPETSPSTTDSAASWAFGDGGTLALPAKASDNEAIFLLCSPSEDPRPFLEAVAGALQATKFELARIFTVVDCGLLCEQPQLKAYYELCLHFSDVFLLGNRSDVSKKWVQGYIDELKKMAVPTRIEYLKADGKVDAVSEFLFPEARRVSQIFDAADGPDDPGLIIESQSEDDDQEDEEEITKFDLRNLENDPYLLRFEDDSFEIKLRTFPEYP